ncbi:hypothetical protein PHYBLDRAFT_66382 [Phycomyces blakesleeanus NRRL 1555(-)]|uniref:Uncharacterized protein n=1 Tax=Phycomyces blakesleeanus (strain ATCC 8743b / DSM 1359 / FGSC 10004 / NBRC 33097 / NRRL 1555) TaxID=763407 RepID=A0A162TVQ3_PHYB8|nr:hypothetical protein PHYBLDRAFT_66382 [Phycomyces blakesleeanus NRRL 1555(-)]OAD71362.1 hypothetical protein PHYBLDRAFT_66382 [Phycomyces blakesleeanus NRRL 1555(-)]|eukprot:XP_018289402.1 hypothetical protein PHYBLDRAFT_66382 [Phycomyces blakesleeanus NRRL 1555(-)]
MINHEKKGYTYQQAIGLRVPLTPPLGKKHHARQSNIIENKHESMKIPLAAINMSFDNVEDANGFAKSVYESKDPYKIFLLRPSFINPRKIDKMPADPSEKCMIM